MPVFFKIYKERRLVMSTVSGVVTLADAVAHREDLRKHPDFDPSFSQLVDLSNVTEIEFSREGVERFAQDTIFSLNSRRAAVARFVRRISTQKRRSVYRRYCHRFLAGNRLPPVSANEVRLEGLEARFWTAREKPGPLRKLGSGFRAEFWLTNHPPEIVSAVATAAIGDGGTRPATGALTDMTAECGRTTTHNGQQHFEMPPTNPLVVY
jgi:hypothetical protein